MNELLFMEKVLRKLSENGSMRRACVIALRVMAGLMTAAGAVTVLTILNAAIDQQRAAMLGSIVYAAIATVGYYMIVHAILLRAHAVAGLPETPYVALSIFGILLRLSVECYGAYTLAMSLGAGIYFWFVGNMTYVSVRFIPQTLYSPLMTSSGSSPFFTGVLLIVSGAVSALVTLVMGYLLAEATGILVEIATNVRHLRREGIPSAEPNPAPTTSAAASDL